jgi:hypothetical protein
MRSVRRFGSGNKTGETDVDFAHTVADGLVPYRGLHDRGERTLPSAFRRAFLAVLSMSLALGLAWSPDAFALPVTAGLAGGLPGAAGAEAAVWTDAQPPSADRLLFDPSENVELLPIAANNRAGSGGDGSGRPNYPTSQISGLPWPSGMACALHTGVSPAVIRAWRGRDLDVLLGWAPIDSWASVFAWLNGGSFGRFVSAAPRRPIVSLPLLTRADAGRFDLCAAGAFDRIFAEVGQTLVRRGVPDAIVRLGWEANRGFPWKIGADPEPYKACFRRAVKAIRSTAPEVLIDWSMGKKGKLAYSVELAWPGDDVVDIVSLSFYDRAPVFTDESVWNREYDSRRAGGPAGLGSWLAFARAHGKKLGLAEWGVSDGLYGGFDNAFFVRKVYEFLKANAKDIAYESYYNCENNGIYKVYPESANPKAGAMYRSLWSSGN